MRDLIILFVHVITTVLEPDVVWALKHAGKKHYEYILGKHVIPAIGDLRLRDVSSDQVQALLKKSWQDIRYKRRYTFGMRSLRFSGTPS